MTTATVFSGSRGSELAMKPSARLTKLLRYASTGLLCSSLKISRQTSPVTSAVVVAMAGMILPAMSLERCLSASAVL